MLLYLYISRFLVERSFYLTLRGINREQKDTVQQLFESNGWPWTVEVTDVCKLYTLKHSPLFAASRYSQVTTFGTASELTTYISCQTPGEAGVLSVSFVFVFHVSPPAVRVGSGRGSQPIKKLWD